MCVNKINGTTILKYRTSDYNWRAKGVGPFKSMNWDVHG